MSHSEAAGGDLMLEDDPVEEGHAVFCNDVFWEHLGKHLNFADLKDCRLVSRAFNRKVLRATNFKRRAVVVLDPGRLNENDFGSTEVKWKNIRFRFRPGGNWEMGGSRLYSQLAEVEELFIQYGDRTGRTRGLSLNNVFESAKCLKKFSVCQHFLMHQEDAPEPGRVEETLKNLVELELLGFDHEELGARASYEWKNYLAGAIKNLKLLRTDGAVPVGVVSGMGSFLRTSDRNFLLDIIGRNGSCLRSLQVHDATLWFPAGDENLDCLSEKQFPDLSVVKIRAREDNMRGIIRFLRRHALLEDLHLVIHNRCARELVNFIGGRKQLKSLVLETYGFESHDNGMWAFLGELEKLETFSLEWLRNTCQLIDTDSDFHHALVSSLPPTARKVKLDGIPTSCGFKPKIVTPKILSQLNPAILTELYFSRCGGCLGDEALEFVFRNFLFLRVLDISSVDGFCTDRGFVGPIVGDTSSFSISNLQGLRSLTISSCEAVTDVTLDQGIKFRELRFLDISNNKRMSEGGVWKVLAQNPSLEILKTSPLLMLDSSQVLRKLYPRLKQLIEIEVPYERQPEVLGECGLGDGGNAGQPPPLYDFNSDRRT